MRYRRGHGFESRSGLRFFQAFISQLMINHVYKDIHSYILKKKKRVTAAILSGRVSVWLAVPEKVE